MTKGDDAGYAVMLQNAKLAQAEKPHAVAMRDAQKFRMKSCPSKMPLGQTRRLHQLELKWIEAEKDRRTGSCLITRVLKALKQNSE